MKYRLEIQCSCFHLHLFSSLRTSSSSHLQSLHLHYAVVFGRRLRELLVMAILDMRAGTIQTRFHFNSEVLSHLSEGDTGMPRVYYATPLGQQSWLAGADGSLGSAPQPEVERVEIWAARHPLLDL